MSANITTSVSATDQRPALCNQPSLALVTVMLITATPYYADWLNECTRKLLFHAFRTVLSDDLLTDTAKECILVWPTDAAVIQERAPLQTCRTQSTRQADCL